MAMGGEIKTLEGRAVNNLPWSLNRTLDPEDTEMKGAHGAGKQYHKQILPTFFGEMAMPVLNLFAIILHPSLCLSHHHLWEVYLCRLCFPDCRGSGFWLGLAKGRHWQVTGGWQKGEIPVFPHMVAGSSNRGCSFSLTAAPMDPASFSSSNSNFCC